MKWDHVQQPIDNNTMITYTVNNIIIKAMNQYYIYYIRVWVVESLAIE